MTQTPLTKKASASEAPIRIAKREGLSSRRAILLRLLTFVMAIVAGGVFIAAMGQNPIEAYKLILRGAFVGSQRNPLSSIQATVIIFVPLLIVSIALSFAFKMKFWNIGGEGQMIIGATFASYFAIFHSDLPHFVLIALMFFAGALGGAFWGLLPTFFKVKFDTNETLFTLMLNYVAIYIVKYLETLTSWRARAGFASIKHFEDNAKLMKIGGVHIGWLLALILIVIAYIYLNHTKQGYEISVVGESQATARYAGMNVKKIILRTMLISGAICGLAGMIQVSGIDYTLSTGMTGGVGFKGITVAWLAQLNPFVMALIAAIFSILEKGSGVMQSTLSISAAATDVLQGIILFSFLGGEFFTRYTFVFSKRRTDK